MDPFSDMLTKTLEEIMPPIMEKYRIRRWWVVWNSINFEMSGASLYSWTEFEIAIIDELHVKGITSDMYTFGPGCMKTLELIRYPRTTQRWPKYERFINFLFRIR